LSGTFLVPENHAVPGSGTIELLHVHHDITPTGVVRAGRLITGHIDGSMNGLIEASGQGEIDSLTIGGDLNGAVEAPEDSTDPNSGIIESITVVGSVGPSGVISTGTLDSGTIDGDMNGLIEASGQGQIDYLLIGGQLDGDVQAPEDSNPDSGVIEQIIIVGDVTSNGTITTGTLDSGTIDGDMNGLIEASGAGVIHHLSIVGSVDSSGKIVADTNATPGSGQNDEFSAGALGNQLHATNAQEI